MSTDMTEKILQEQAQEQAEQELFMMEFARAMKSMNLGLRHDRRVSDSIISKVGEYDRDTIISIYHDHKK